MVDKFTNFVDEAEWVEWVKLVHHFANSFMGYDEFISKGLDDLVAYYSRTGWVNYNHLFMVMDEYLSTRCEVDWVSVEVITSSNRECFQLEFYTP